MLVQSLRKRGLRSLSLATVTVALLMSQSLAQFRPSERTPEGVIRLFVRSMYANDVATYERLSIPDPRRSLLIRGGSVNQTAVDEIDQDPSSIQIKVKRDFQFQGKAASQGASGDYAVGTTVLYMVAHRGGPMVVTLARRSDGWKVDLRWWLAMVEMTSAKGPRTNGADSAVRSLLASMLAMDRKQAQRFIMPGGSMDLLFAGASSQREPSGHLDALVAEMPLVAVGPGEFYEMPSRRIVEGLQRDDLKVLVGQFGVVEMPFIVHRVGNEWKVEVEPYFILMMR